MSISTATSRSTSATRLPHSIIAAGLALIAVLAAVIAYAASSSTTASPTSARPAAGVPVQTVPTPGFSSVVTVPGGSVRDPATHALLPIPVQTSAGHKSYGVTP
jgi:hypothetical protein